MGRTIHFLRSTRFQFGKLVFPMLEPFCILWENICPEVRRHFEQAIRSLERHNLSVGLLNLNMVLSLRPNHFLARVYRGRIYLRENQFRLASDDFIQANEISPYRFTHYQIHEEYLEAVSLNARRRQQEQALEYGVSEDAEGLAPLNERLEECSDDYDDEEVMFLEEDLNLTEEELELTEEERIKFEEMGPITGPEADQTNWDRVIRQLTARRRG